MTKQPLRSPSIKEIEQYILPEETVLAMKTAIAHPKTQIEYLRTIMEAQALFGCVRSTKPEPTPTKHEDAAGDNAESAEQDLKFWKPILIGGTVLAAIFLTYFFTLIFLAS